MPTTVALCLSAHGMLKASFPLLTPLLWGRVQRQAAMSLMESSLWTAGTQESPTISSLSLSLPKSLQRRCMAFSEFAKEPSGKADVARHPGEAERRQEGSTGCGDGCLVLSPAPEYRLREATSHRHRFPEKQACQVLVTKTRWQMPKGLGGRG